MPRAHATAPPDAIRIEEEVWEEAFSRREPVSDNRRRRLRAIEGGQSDWLNESVPEAPESGVSRPSTTLAQADASAPELPAATWLGTSPRANEGRAFSASPPVARQGRVAPARRLDPAPLADRLDASPPVRRTVKIQGRGAERHLPVPDPARRRPARRPYERDGFRPDRLAMWAVVLGFLLVFVAIASGHG